MASLDGKDRAGVREVVWVGDGCSGSEVGSDSDAFKDRSESDEGGGVSGWEGVSAFCNGGGAKSGGQERNVGCLVRGDFHQIRVEGVGEASVDEVRLRVVGKTFTVELVFEVLESESIIEDFDCRLVSRERDREKMVLGSLRIAGQLTISDACTLGDDRACGCDGCKSSDRECVLHDEGLGVS